MATIYRVQMMDQETYRGYMNGAMLCMVDHVDVEANTVEEAVALVKAMYPCMVVNEYPKTFEEVWAEENRRQADREEADRKAKEKAKRAKEKEETKAKEMGMTVEEYKAHKRHARKIREAEREVEKLAAMLAEAQARLNKVREGK